MKMRACTLLFKICLVFAVSYLIGERPASQAEPGNVPIYVVLWFDTEDYILPRSDDAAKRLAEMLKRLNIKATFKVVGEMARALERRGRRDVITALLDHEIGYHSNTHSQQPTVAVYLQNAGWTDGSAEFERREGQGVKDIQRIFGVLPTCYGQPGSAWAPQTYPALKHLGINIYLDEGDHVGLDDQPFYYCGMFNVFQMKSTVARMEFGGPNNLDQAKTKFRNAYNHLRQRQGGTISIYYHPNEFVHREFWDAINFSRGKNPPRDQWRVPATKSEPEIQRAFDDFQEYISFIKAQPSVRFVTASELARLYADASLSKNFNLSHIISLGKFIQTEINFQIVDTAPVSAAEVFSLLNSALFFYLHEREWPMGVRTKQLYGPTRPFSYPSDKAGPSVFPWYAFANAVRDVESYTQYFGRIPDEVWIGVERISPEDYFATLASIIEELVATRRHPEPVQIREGKLATKKYVAEDSPKRWAWIIFPEGFRAPKIMELAQLQSWTLKPALLRDQSDFLFKRPK